MNLVPASGPETSSIYSAQLSMFHVKTETESHLWDVVLIAFIPITKMFVGTSHIAAVATEYRQYANACMCHWVYSQSKFKILFWVTVDVSPCQILESLDLTLMTIGVLKYIVGKWTPIVFPLYCQLCNRSIMTELNFNCLLLCASSSPKVSYIQAMPVVAAVQAFRTETVLLGCLPRC
jgi:hypothetical protein